MAEIPVYKTTIQVTTSDADELGHVNNTRYIHWMQNVATDHSAALGWTSERYSRLGQGWVVRRHVIDYIRQAYPGDILVAETWVAEMKNVFSVRKYLFTRVGDGQVVAKAETRWGFIDFATGRPVKIPSEISGLFSELKDR